MSASESNLSPLDGPDPVHLAVTLARSFGETHGLAPQDAARLAVVVEELVMNLFDHGGVTGGAGVLLGIVREAGGVRMLLVDPGSPFDPRSCAVEAAIPDRGGGAGLALVRAWAEIVDYRSGEGVNRLELRLPDGGV